MYGLEVVAVSVLPRVINGHWYWGYAKIGGGEIPKIVYLAPYLMALLWIAAGVLIEAYAKPESLHLSLFLVVLLVVSSVVDIVYNLGKWIFRGTGDFAEIFGCN
jgi:hypothetical protein